MPLKIFQRGKIYYVRGSVKGIKVYESTGESKRADADAYVPKTELVKLRGKNQALRESLAQKLADIDRAIGSLQEHWESLMPDDIQEWLDIIEANTIAARAENGGAQ